MPLDKILEAAALAHQASLQFQEGSRHAAAAFGLAESDATKHF